MFLTLSLVIILSATVYLYFRYQYTYWARLGIPFIPPKFPHGNLDKILPRGISMGLQSKRYYDELTARNLKYGGVYGLHRPMLVICDLDLIKDVLVKDFKYFEDRGVYHDKRGDPINENMFGQDAAEWKTLRQKFSPAFTAGKIRQVSVMVNQIAQEMIRATAPGVIDAKKLAHSFTINVIGRTVFGIECNCFDNPNGHFQTNVLKIFDPSFTTTVNLFFAHYLPRVGKMLGVTLFNKEVNEFFFKLVDEMYDYRVKNDITRPDLFQALVDMRRTNKDFGLKEMTAQASLFFVAGFETSASTIMYCLLELSRKPHLQERLRAEVLNGPEELTYDAVCEMKYLQQCVDETLRLYPVVTTLTRLSKKNYTFRDSTTIPKNTLVLIPICGVQWDENVWPNPLEFDPERFSENNRRSMHGAAYLPFGDGPRNCIGFRFGLMQVMIGLAAMLRNFRFKVHEDTVYPPKIDKEAFVMVNLTDIKLVVEKI